MKRTTTARIQDLIGLVHHLYPPGLAEEWDNVGLQLGDPAAPVSRVLVALDPSPTAFAAARERDAQLLICHHPLIFRPLKCIVSYDETGRLIQQACRDNLAVMCAHTNLDRAADGLNDWLAARLGVVDSRPLAGDDARRLYKLVVYVPCGYEDRVAEALFAAGAGKIGGYDRCSFQGAGSGTFRPGDTTTPFIGHSGTTERVREIRLETVVPTAALAKVLERMLKAHPYEEVAYDLLPLANRLPHVGLGRIGRLPTPRSLGDFAGQIKELLGVPALRLCGDLNATVAKVAVCGGSGASLLAEAARQGADVLVTGDVKYHEAQSALSRNVAVIDAGHFATERLMVPMLSERLQREADQRGLPVTILPMTGECDPFTFL